MNFLLKLKHWQLFILLFLGTGILSISSIMLLNTVSNNRVSIGDSIIPMVIAYFLIASWIIKSIVILEKKNQILTTKQLKIVKFGTYFLIFYAFKLLNIDLQLISLSFDFLPFRILSFITHPIAFFLYYYFVFLFAKLLVTNKYGNNSRTGDYILELLKVFFFPIGIWILQPTLNKIYNEQNK